MLQHIVPYTNIASAQDQFSNGHYLICAYIYHFYIKGVKVHIVIHIVISWWSVLSQRSPYIHLYPSEVITRQFFSPPSYSHSFSHCFSSPSYHSHGYLHCSQASMKGHPWHNICLFTLYISPFHIRCIGSQDCSRIEGSILLLCLLSLTSLYMFIVSIHYFNPLNQLSAHFRDLCILFRARPQGERPLETHSLTLHQDIRSYVR